jgi:predicted DCC family thiol-disulfide oxidoreductase YuxK
MEFHDSLPLMIYDNRCHVCIKFAKLMNFLAKGKLRMIGHYTDLGKKIRNEILDEDALEMFWYIDRNTAYGGRAAIIPLLSAILRVHGRKFNKVTIQESCDIGCKDSLAVFFRSASLITHSRKIKISNL